MGSFFDTRPLQLAPTKSQTQDLDNAPQSSADITSPNMILTRPRVYSTPSSSIMKDAEPQNAKLGHHSVTYSHRRQDLQTLGVTDYTSSSARSIIETVQMQSPIGRAIAALSDRLASPSESRHTRHHQSMSTDPLHTLAHSNTGINVTTRSKDEEGMKILSIIHTMIQQINRQFPRDIVLQTTIGGFVKTTSIDYGGISAIFTQYRMIFRPKDLMMWQTIAQQIHKLGGFFIGRDQQRWFDELEAEYTRLRTSLVIRDMAHG